jgi:hypothetical protein
MDASRKRRSINLFIDIQDMRGSLMIEGKGQKKLCQNFLSISEHKRQGLVFPQDIESDNQKDDSAQSFRITAQAGGSADGLSQV